MARITVVQLQARIAELEQQVAELGAQLAQRKAAVAPAGGVIIGRHGQRAIKRFAPRSVA